MEKRVLLTYCHYYDGSEENPFEEKARKVKVAQNWAMLWFYESYWCNMMLEAGSAEDVPLGLAEYADEYKAVGLETFMQSDVAPLSLKALLFNRYAKCSGGGLADAVEDFKKFYSEYYGIWDYFCKSRSRLVETCHYYKGEEEPPEGVDPLLWGYEKCWVDTVEREIVNNERGGTVASWLCEYRKDGLHTFMPPTEYSE